MNKNSNLRPHLTKELRLPNCYKEVEKIIKSVKSCEINIKTALATCRLRGQQMKKVYKLSLNILKYYNYIQKIIDQTQILEKENFLRREIATILIYELIFGNGFLPGQSKPVTTVQAYEKNIRKQHQELLNISSDITKQMYVPRYVRVHTLITTVAYVIKDLENCGFNQHFYDENISEEKFIQLVISLEKGNFMVDFHFKDILVFAEGENLIGLDLYKKGHIFLQDKSSYIPVHVLNPEPKSFVIDACAAPGMKTVHIASKMKNKGLLIACERNKNRCEILKETLQYGSVKISQVLCTDFRDVDPNDEAYCGVDYILLDPSCSGSGMVNRMDDVTDTEDSKTKERVQKLAGFQIILLKHALKFPSVKRVVYSTCSVYEEENEYVVHEALQAFSYCFKLAHVMPEWTVRGSKNYEYGKMCLRTVPEKHLTNGFFVAMFERISGHDSTRENFPFNNDFCGRTVIKTEDKQSKKVDSHFEKLKLKATANQEMSCEMKKIDNKKEDHLKNKKTLFTDNSFSSIKEEKRGFNSLQYTSSQEHDFQLLKPCEKSCDSESFENENKCDENYKNSGDIVYSNFEEKKDILNSPKTTKHKKKKRKDYISDIPCQLDKQNQEKLLTVNPLDSFQKRVNSEMLKDMPLTMYKSADENINFPITEKKSKHKRHHSSENQSVVAGGYCKELIDIKSKHKKKKKHDSVDEYNSRPAEVSCDACNTNVAYETDKINQCLGKNYTHRNYYSKDELKPPEDTKHMKEKKGKDFATDIKYQSNEQNQMESSNVIFSDNFQKLENSTTVTAFSSEPEKLPYKKAKHKKHHHNLESNTGIDKRDCAMSLDVISKHKKKKRKKEHSSAENISFFCPTQITKPENQTDISASELSKQTRMDETVLSCNIPQNINEDLYETTVVNLKKSKKHKRESNSSDLKKDLPGYYNSEKSSSVVNTNNVSQIEMNTEQYVNNSFKCKKKKHKKHLD